MWNSRKLILALVKQLRPLSQRVPGLAHLGRVIGLGKWLRAGDMGRLMLDGDVPIELDLSVKGFRYLFYMTDLARSPEIALIKGLSQPDGAFVDVGANIGYFSLVAAKYFSRVIAIEPSQFNLQYLRRNLELNPALSQKVTVMPFALSSRKEEHTLFRPSDQPLAASLRPVEKLRTTSETVPCETLDALVPADMNVSLLKLDIEGAEYEALLGGTRTVGKNRPAVICELSEPMQNRFGHSLSDLLAYFTTRNYAVYQVNDPNESHGRPLLSPSDSAHPTLPQSSVSPTNVLFWPTERTLPNLLEAHR